MTSNDNTIEETTQYFESEYELELEHWVRRRFRNLCIALLAILIGLWILVAGVHIAYLFGAPEGPRVSSPGPGVYGYVVSFIFIALILWFLVIVRPRLETKDQLTSSATRLIMMLSLLAVLGHIGARFFDNTTTSAPLGEMFFFHFVACLFLPWTPWQSLKAIGPAYLLWLGDRTSLIMGVSIAQDLPWTTTILYGAARLLEGIFLAIIFVPGLVLCWIRLRRHGRRFRTEMLGRQFLSMRRELKQARRIHDALFPSPVSNENYQFGFEYTPHTDIGGDFVVFDAVDTKVRVILIDVTGHGLAAAMTVNRIHGEIERIRAEHPDGDPALMMSLLDRYFVLTLAPHNIYATGLAYDLDLANGTLKWVNAGHPPAFVVARDGTVRELDTTTVMLGAMDMNDFEPEQEQMSIEPGEIIIAYTDGVIESRNPQGEMLGLDRLRDLVRGTLGKENWPKRIRTLVNTHARGAFEDDLLIVALDYLANTKHSASALERKPSSKEPTRA